MKSIPFSECFNLNDSQYLVCTGLLVNDENHDETVDMMTKSFRDTNLIKDDVSVDHLLTITGNVRESTGDYRHDIVIVFSKETEINPLARLQWSSCGIKWVSDFVDNYRNDYIM